MAKYNPFLPAPGLLVKLGSIAVHADEYNTVDGHPYDLAAMRELLADPEVRAWLAAMDGGAFLPLRRDGIRYK